MAVKEMDMVCSKWYEISAVIGTQFQLGNIHFPEVANTTIPVENFMCVNEFAKLKFMHKLLADSEMLMKFAS